MSCLSCCDCVVYIVLLWCCVLKVVALRQELTKMQAIAERAQSTWDKFRKERDFHRMHHKRVVQVRGRLLPLIRAM